MNLQKQKPTITAKTGYYVKRIPGTFNIVHLIDGNEFVMRATLRSWDDLIDELELGGNECAAFCECFETIGGIRCIYWRDEEIDEDYLTYVEEEEAEPDKEPSLREVLDDILEFLKDGLSEEQQEQLDEYVSDYLERRGIKD